MKLYNYRFCRSLLLFTFAILVSPLFSVAQCNYTSSATINSNFTCNTLNISGSSVVVTVTGSVIGNVEACSVTNGARLRILNGADMAGRTLYVANGTVEIDGGGCNYYLESTQTLQGWLLVENGGTLYTDHGGTLTVKSLVPTTVKDANSTIGVYSSFVGQSGNNVNIQNGGRFVVHGGNCSVNQITANDANSEFKVDDFGVAYANQVTCTAQAKMTVRNAGTLHTLYLRLGGPTLVSTPIITHTVDAATLNMQGNSMVELSAESCILLIKNYATANVKRFRIPERAKLRVEGNSTINMGYLGEIDVLVGSTSNVSGGVLEVLNSTITGNNWHGISVEGGNGHTVMGITRPYLSHSAVPSQAGLAFFSNATVEKSTQGITNWYNSVLPLFNGYIDANGILTSGGIIQAENSTFKNHQVAAVRFANFNNKTTSNQPINDASYFHNCTFSIDNNYSFSSSPYSLVYANSVRGVKFFGCNFTDACSSQNFTSPAIYLDGGGLIIDGGCYCPPGSACAMSTTNPCIGGTMMPSTFSNLSKAVFATGQWSGANLIVRNTKFENISEGAITLQGTSAAVIANNSIKLVSNGITPVYGIAAAGSQGFRIENNEITGDNSNNTVGIVANDNQNAHNEIFRNSIGTSSGTPNIAVALQANGWNYDKNAPNEGLRFFCNVLWYNAKTDARDITVNAVFNSPLGIAGTQGYWKNGNKYGSRNQFASKTNPTGDEHILMDPGANPTNYFWGSTYSNEQPQYTTSAVTLSAASNNHSCANGSYYNGTSPNWVAFVADRDALATLIDAADIAAVDDNGYCAYDEHLTNYAQLTNIMIHKYLNPEMTYTGDINTSAITDTLPIHIDSLLMVLDGTKYIYDYKMWQAGIYAERGQYQDAYNTLDGILQGEYALSTEEESVIEDFRGLLALKETLVGNDNDWSAVSTTTKNWVRDLVSNGVGHPRYMARYFLALYEQEYIMPEVFLYTQNEGEKTTPGNKPEIQPFTSSAQPEITIYPNPVGSRMQIHVRGFNGALTAEIYDLAGRRLRMSKMNANGVTYLDTEMLAPGSYTVKVLREGKIVSARQIVKQ